MDIDIECQEKKVEENLKKYVKSCWKNCRKNLCKIKKMWLKCQDDETIMCEGVIRYSYIQEISKKKAGEQNGQLR